jgi:hypothetical protein
VLALVMVGFAHRPLMAAPYDGVDMTAYLLPDGTLPVICVDGKADDKPEKMAYHGCDACRLSASILLAEPPVAMVRIAHSAPADLAAIRRIFLPQRLYPPNARPRAPPVLLFSV